MISCEFQCMPILKEFPSPKNKGHALERYLVKYQIIWVKLWHNVTPHNSCKMMFPCSRLSERNSCQSLSVVTWCGYLWKQPHFFFLLTKQFYRNTFFWQWYVPKVKGIVKGAWGNDSGKCSLGIKGRTKTKENNLNVWDCIANKHRFWVEKKAL